MAFQEVERAKGSVSRVRESLFPIGLKPQDLVTSSCDHSGVCSVEDETSSRAEWWTPDRAEPAGAGKFLLWCIRLVAAKLGF